MTIENSYHDNPLTKGESTVSTNVASNKSIYNENDVLVRRDDDDDESPRVLLENDEGDNRSDKGLLLEMDSIESQSGTLWEPSGNRWKDLLYFCGPGWLVSIAYVDPGNYQADIQAGATSRYNLLFSVWWSSVLSMYVQILCVRLGYYAQQTLAQVQAQEFRQRQSPRLRYFAWFIAEFSVVMTDLPEVIGIGIALNLFFGWPYWIGVVLSLLTTMSFLATQNLGMHVLEYIIVGFVGIMSVALFVEMSFVGANGEEIVKGWLYGFVNVTSDDLFSITGILGAVVMPHNLYLHTASVQTRKVQRRDDVVQQAVWYCSIEPILPILVSFCVNVAVVSIAAERVYGKPNAEYVGLTDFCSYFLSLKGGCLLWGIALLAAGQSSAITTTYTGQSIMDGFLKIRLPTEIRAIVTRLIAITPCVIVSVIFPKYLNAMVNVVNAALSFLLPFALLPLIKYNCTDSIMGPGNASKGVEKKVLYGFGILVWAINAITMSVPGGGFFGDIISEMEWSTAKICLILFQVALQVVYAWWSFSCLFTPVSDHVPLPVEDERRTTIVAEN
ncbi:NRAMP family Mn2+/Fe2+ transporter [Nitzschia inconspicua]|uniref:NRAMP family Mn2+/Fe2+ transporter n=1 Tax=Nitzschia inconspicua TaxID=303405 RepID=A0A9K3PAW4_9STRA|nr:NRAMP family Mn2+/Fe2+ transporter [Nitzschia inconspicua]KAG7365943.1 NRAMP family Mn2+/Fe2+ transporter [Nitzschia inconspicua]